MDENARKRKREEEGESSEVEGIQKEKPREGLAASRDKPKRLKKSDRAVDADTEAGEALPDSQAAKAEKRRARRDQKKAKAEARAKRRQAKKSQRADNEASKQDRGALGREQDGHNAAGSTEELGEGFDLNEVDDTVTDSKTIYSPASPYSKEQSPTFDVPANASGISSSTSSSLHPADPSSTQPEQSSIKPEPVQSNNEPEPTTAADEPKPSHEELRSRLHTRIAEMRLARKADHEDGTPVRTRQELLDQRHAKAARKQERKKKLRQQAKEEEQRQKARALAHGSPLLSPSGEAPPSEPERPSDDDDDDDGEAAHFSFGRVAFDDGAVVATHDLQDLIDPRPKKGRSDARSALVAARARAARLAGLDPAKRAAAEEHDAWVAARKRAQGERVRDDPALLRKTVKRKEGQKRKSEREWNARLDGVRKGQEARQAKRAANLKTKKTRGTNGKKEAKAKAKKGRKERPGFEGSFKTGGKRS